MWYLVPVLIACLAYIDWYVLTYWRERMYAPQPPEATGKLIYLFDDTPVGRYFDADAA